MPPSLLAQEAEKMMHYLCLELPGRRVGSDGNRAAAQFIADQFARRGLAVEYPPFDCLDWSQQGASLSAAGQGFAVLPGPFSPGREVRAPLAAASTLPELEAVQAEGKILLLYGELTCEQLMPKNFPFYNPDEHRHIYRLVEGSHPAAVLSATRRSPSTAGAMYPFPLFEDGDFDIPSAYMTETEGARLLSLLPAEAELRIKAERRAAQGSNVLARRLVCGNRRVVLSAHLDAKDGTPGALDNAGGVTALLILAELLRHQPIPLGVEFVIFNGEDYYAACGEIQYLRQNVETLKDIVLNINLDGLGYREGKTAYSFYQCPPQIELTVRQVLGGFEGLEEGEAWFQGDHMIFVQNDLPALAITSQQMDPLWMEIAHTARDVPALVDAERLVEAAHALKTLLLRMSTATD